MATPRRKTPVKAKTAAKATAKAVATAVATAVGRTTASRPASTSETPVLLSGGNPQIAKGDGDEPVQAYIAAMPDWKREIGEQLDALITKVVPGVRKAVRWNSPFYGIEGQGWFLSFHCFTKYVKVTFLNGASLTPPPPIASKHPAVRYAHLAEGEPLDEARFRRWIERAASIPGDPLF
jgi:hypothetical protein